MKQDNTFPRSTKPMLALDLDGTLLNSRKEISPRTLDALLDVQRRGATLVIASGRPPCGSAPFAHQLELAQHGGFVIAFNGAQILECSTGKKLYDKALPLDILPLIHALSQRPSCTMLTYVDDEILTGDKANSHVQYAARINRMTVRQTENLPKAVSTPVPKCIIAGPADELDIVEESVRHRSPALPLSIVRSEPFFLEFMPEAVDKGAAVSLLLSITGRNANSLIAFGDSYNDAAMLALAGTSVAMQNARPEIRASAHFTTASNDEDGIAHYLESHRII